MKYRLSPGERVGRFLQGLFPVVIAQSSLRGDSPRTVHVSGVAIRGTGLVSINRQDFMPSGVCIESPQGCILVDPLLCGNQAQIADIILITHDHPDHFSPRDVAAHSGPGTIVCGPRSIGDRVEKGEFIPVEHGRDYSLSGMRVSAVPAYNLKPVFMGIYPHARGIGVGYILETGCIRIYLAGDTDDVPELAALPPLDVAIIPIGGDGLTMDPESAAGVVRRIAPRLAIPVHFTVGKNLPERFSRAVGESVPVESLV